MPIRDSLSRCYFNKTTLNWITLFHSWTQNWKKGKESKGEGGWKGKIIISYVCENIKIFVAIFHVISCGVNYQLWNKSLFCSCGNTEKIFYFGGGGLNSWKLKSKHQEGEELIETLERKCWIRHTSVGL
mgnify:CR=1 FL=1